MPHKIRSAPAVNSYLGKTWKNADNMSQWILILVIIGKMLSCHTRFEIIRVSFHLLTYLLSNQTSSFTENKTDSKIVFQQICPKCWTPISRSGKWCFSTASSSFRRRLSRQDTPPAGNRLTPWCRFA
jgi:hypothetical protein